MSVFGIMSGKQLPASLIRYFLMGHESEVFGFCISARLKKLCWFFSKTTISRLYIYIYVYIYMKL